MENTVIQQTFLKFNRVKKPQIFDENAEHKMKEKNPRSSFKKPAVATLVPTWDQRWDRATGSGVPEPTPAGFCVFALELESKIWEKPDPESLFNFGSSWSLLRQLAFSS